MELLRYWKIIRKSQWIIALICVVGLISTGVYTLNQAPQYVSSATLALNPNVPGSLLPYVQSQLAANLADTYNKYIHTRSFAYEVQKEVPTLDINDVIGSVSTTLAPNTLFYEMSVRADSPEKSKQALDAILKVFLSDNSQQAATPGGSNTANQEMRAGLQGEIDYFQDQLNSYQSRIDELAKQPFSKERDDEILLLRGQIVTLHQTRVQTIVALGQLGEESGSGKTAQVIDAPLPGTGEASNITSNLGLALFVSLLIGLGVAFLRAYLDDTVTTPEYLEAELGITQMAAIGFVGEQSGRGYWRNRRSKGLRGRGMKADQARSEWVGRNLVTLERPKSPEAESFRELHTNIQFSSLDKPLRSLVVTSARPGEGKSFTASNLAVVIAQTGKRVILVDADLRKPTQHRIFDLPNSIGFTNLILSRSTWLEGAIQPVEGIENLAVITSGPHPPSPPALLNAEQTVQVMKSLAQQADIVIYDSPPGEAATDTMIIATRTDAVILVINAGTTRRNIVKRVIKNLRKVGVTAIMPVLNRVASCDLQGYYHYYGHYGIPAAGAPANRKSNDNHTTNGVSASNGRSNGKANSKTVVATNGKQPKSTAPDDDPAQP